MEKISANDDLLDEEEEEDRWKRPPSSYGSMKSESLESGDEGGEREGAAGGETVALPVPETSAPAGFGLPLNHPVYTETMFTETTQQTKPEGAVVIETELVEEDDETDEELLDEDEILLTCSPEPPEPLEMEDFTQIDENSQPGKLHPEQALPHLFKSIQEILSRLNDEELFKFRMWFHKWKPASVLQQMLEGDLLDFVDRIIEMHGPDKALASTISTLESMDKKEDAADLRSKCQKALFRFYWKEHLIRKHQVIHEGVVQPGKQHLLNNVYVEPQISTCGYGGVDPAHEISPQRQSLVQLPTEDTFVPLNDLFRLQKDDGSPVRTVVTTGLPGVGMSVSVAKFCLDWAEQCANRDLHYVIKISFRSLWFLRNRKNPSKHMSIYNVLEYYHADIKNLKMLEEEDTRFLVIMDAFDCYQAPLDWKNTPVIKGNESAAHMDTLVVNIIRGSVLRGAHLWILGRRAAVTQIPSHFIDVITELQGFSDEMKDEYLTKRFTDAELAANIVSHYKRVPTLQILARHPFFCWILATMFSRSFRYVDYGRQPPRLTPFLIHFVTVQMNRRLQFYHDMFENQLKWENKDKELLMKIGKMAFSMLERGSCVVSEQDVKGLKLQLSEVVVQSGLFTELKLTGSSGRTFSFSHVTFQEFMAALYVFMTFYIESKNLLDASQVQTFFTTKHNTKSAAGLVQCAVARTLSAPLGRYDMFLRCLCGLISPTCHFNLFRGLLFPHNKPKLGGLEEARQALEQVIQTSSEDRRSNLMECLREMTQEDD